ncbi:MAG: ATP phosphoribosyltransferase [Thermoproteota archaeon]|nr:ATP phosphoribosyltransferase [Candidatus Brockarchaeota archaeon]
MLAFTKATNTSVRFAIPKGSLELQTYKFLEEAGYSLSGQERSYRPSINDPELSVKILRPQEIPQLVEEGAYDIGITGLDWIYETSANVEVLQDLEYGAVSIVLAVSKNWEEINSFEDLLKKTLAENRPLKIYTEYINLSLSWIINNSYYRSIFGNSEPQIITPWMRKGSNEKVKLFLSFGATEAKPPEDSDAIIDAMSTGITLEENELKPICTIFNSTARLIANKNSLKTKKKEKILDVLSLFKGVVEARKRLHIFVNVKEENLQVLLSVLPALKGPTVSPLSQKGWYAVNTVIEKSSFLKILPMLRKYAQGLVVHSPRQVMSLEEVKIEE